MNIAERIGAIWDEATGAWVLKLHAAIFFAPEFLDTASPERVKAEAQMRLEDMRRELNEEIDRRQIRVRNTRNR